MGKLNQVIAVEKGSKTRLNDEFTAAYHVLQKPELLVGLARSYTPKEDGGDTLPPENKKLVVRVEDILTQTAKVLTQLFDITATKDAANCNAKADIVLPGEKTPILTDVCVSHLLFLEKQLADLHTVVKKLPTLDPSENWTWSKEQNCYLTAPVETVKTKKVPKNHVKAEATDKHPAQVETYHEDVVQGTWKTIKLCGALPAERVASILERVEKLLAAVKTARQTANETEAPPREEGAKIFGYLFAK